jgi:threonine/homoserine/homoserine lactone efflux protein
MSATVFRTVEGGITQNRLTIIGWNSINIGILIYLLVSVLRAGEAGWLPALHQSFKVAGVAYLAWTVFLILAIPILF